ncbi:MAG: 4-hydroxy-tetrahydrodipicolinate reductase [Deltaproteobacteria bacterium CG07_land_8_20_14_0_80_38_7]|nr:MAG: 4-hydroxy-tetrahydrodipicolinate reductase [Deltaproteobacteria bacterium CG07_land_8_20_14_0_80_38_7]
MLEQNKIKIVVSGARGRMGALIVKLIKESDDLIFTGEAEEACPLDLVVEKADVVVDFSTPAATVANTEIASLAEKPMVIGTTGLIPEQEAQLKKASERIPIVYAPNMSIGVNLLWKLVAEAVNVLNPKFKIDIIEEHHIHKKDMPSGTAKKIMSIIEQNRRYNKDDILVCKDRLPEKDKRKALNVCSIRQGETIGDHKIIFSSDSEIIEISHKALGREVFAEGALTACRWIKDKPKGLYSMNDVLGL